MKLKIATYNLWNHPDNQRARLAATADELRLLSADVVALQEVPVTANSGEPFGRVFRDSGYSHAAHLRYPDIPDPGETPEGLGFLSKSPLLEVQAGWDEGNSTENSWVATTHIELAGTTISITNVHLDWRSAESRRQAIEKFAIRSNSQKPSQIEFLCGDFNDENPPVEILNSNQEPGYTSWSDVSEVMFRLEGVPLSPTLDPATNPRWRVSTRHEPTKRLDRIYFRSRQREIEIRPISAGVFGKYPDNHLELVPSDHYGVYADFEID